MINEQILEADKGDLIGFCQNIVEGIENGEIDGLKMYVIGRKLEELGKILKGSTQTYIQDSDYVKTGQNNTSFVRLSNPAQVKLTTLQKMKNTTD